jgi:hypothetical protein
METLDKIFGSAGKVRMMRLFLHNPLMGFSLEEVVERTLTPLKEVKEEIANLEQIDLIKRKVIQRKDNPDSKRSKKTTVWVLNQKFSYIPQLQNFLINATIVKNSDLIKRLNRIGKIKLIVIAGVFINQWDESRVDLLVVGDGLKRGSFEQLVKKLESEVGKELKYAIFETSDFLYRLNMYDKLVRDILDYPHQVILDRIGIEKLYSDK